MANLNILIVKQGELGSDDIKRLEDSGILVILANDPRNCHLHSIHSPEPLKVTPYPAADPIKRITG